jgi:hypothetical protein
VAFDFLNRREDEIVGAIEKLKAHVDAELG